MNESIDIIGYPHAH